MLTCGQINDYCHDINGIGITEPSDNFYKSGKPMIGRTLATANENVPVHAINLSNEEVSVYKGTVVGQFEQAKKDSNKVNLGVKNIFITRTVRRNDQPSFSKSGGSANSKCSKNFGGVSGCVRFNR